MDFISGVCVCVAVGLACETRACCEDCSNLTFSPILPLLLT